MIIEVGKKYIRRDCKIVEIKSSHRSIFVDNRILFVDSDNKCYYENGSYWSDNKYSKFDLIKEVKGE